MKITPPKEELADSMHRVEGFSQNQIHLIGILPWLTLLAAVRPALLMVGAFLTHLRRAGSPNLIGNIVLLALAVFVAIDFS